MNGKFMEVIFGLLFGVAVAGAFWITVATVFELTRSVFVQQSFTQIAGENWSLATAISGGERATA